MDWVAIQAITEVAGLLAVVGSLVYIGIQTKQANDHALASSETVWLNAMNQIINSWVSDERTTTVVRRGFRNFNALSKSDQALFHMRIGALVNHWLLAEQLSSKNLLSKEISEEMTKLVVAVLATPGGLQYWEHDYKATPRGEELLATVKSSVGRTPTITDILPWWAADESE